MGVRSSFAFLLVACGPVCPPGQHVEEQNCRVTSTMICIAYGKYGCNQHIPTTYIQCDHVCVGPVWAENEEQLGEQ